MVYVYGTFSKGDIDMSKFKVGDKVRVIHTDPSDWYNEGDVGEVVEESIARVFGVKFGDGYVGYAIEDQLELVSDNTLKWWETPEGIEWLSAQLAVEEQFFKSQEKTYEMGQRFVVSCEGSEWHCILAQVEPYMVCLINLESGNRINDPVHVFNLRKITKDEMKMMAGDCSFRLL